MHISSSMYCCCCASTTLLLLLLLLLVVVDAKRRGRRRVAGGTNEAAADPLCVIREGFNQWVSHSIDVSTQELGSTYTPRKAPRDSSG